MENDGCCKTRQQIAEELNISRTTLYRRLKEANLTLAYNQLFSPAECVEINKLFG